MKRLIIACAAALGVSAAALAHGGIFSIIS